MITSFFKTLLQFNAGLTARDSQEKSSTMVPADVSPDKPAEDTPASPVKPVKDKRKLEKAPKHDPPTTTRATKRTARKSIANAPATVPQKIAKVGRIPKLSGDFSVF